MENLFLQAMTISEREEIENIKANKAFIRRLMDDLKKVYKIYPEVYDSQNQSKIYLGQTSNHKYDVPYFRATAENVTFNVKTLGYRDCSFYGTLLFDLYKKYESTSKADSNFLESKSGLGNIEFIIEIPLTGCDSQLRDVMAILNLRRYNKVF